ncbi:MAG: Nre family DNA repair protein [Candidatus Bathyarchaeota archaeon]|nr:Nre family DNA repair protein [Candidatus Termiticorpusculum sp.]
MTFSDNSSRDVRPTDDWLKGLLKHANTDDGQIVARVSQDSMCVICKGARNLCGKTRCPIMVKVHYFNKSISLMSNQDISGMSPPSVFIGRVGYPNVYAGPLVPPVSEDTSIYDLPEQWFGKSIDEIVGFRSMLVRGKHRVNVANVFASGKILDATRELALADNSVNMELNLTKKPSGSLFLDDDVQPFGPSAPIRDMRVGNAKYERHIEKAYYDTDLKSINAVLELYGHGVVVTKIQKAFSVGAFGIEKSRRLVPTRWSITAVDDIISKNLREQIKSFPEINEYRVYESNYLDNVFEILMIPDYYSYEALEAWYPGTVWNPAGKSVTIFSDWEGSNGRTTYASIGGGYYASRIAACEQLIKERRQATIVVLRETRPGYIMPIGVWQVRENVRNAMLQKPFCFKTLPEALQHIDTRFNIPLGLWLSQSKLLKQALYQKKMLEYF